MANSNVKVNITTDFDSAGAKAAERELRRVANMQMAAQREMAAAEDRAAAQRKAAMGTITTAAGALGLALTAAAGAAVVMSARFDSAMSAVGATGVENLDALRDAALQAGRDTAYSAIEAAQGIEQLAKAGLVADDILSGGLTATLDLAAAGELEVARASEITAVTLKQFGLAGEDAAHVADLLAAGANKAVGGVEDLAAGLEYVGPVAAQMGVSVEETTGALALFAEQGILGEKAGTGLRGVLMSLTAPTAASAKVMDDYGISVFDAAGNFVGLAGMAEQLRAKLGPLDEATRSAALGQIFGNAQITAARILYAGGGQAIEDWTAAVDDSGYAAEMAAKRLDNLQGDVQILRGSLETLMISLGDGAQGPLRELTQGVTSVVDVLSSMPPEAQSALLAIVGGAGVLTLGAAGAVKLTTALGEAKVAMQTLGITAGKVTAATAGIGGVLAIAGLALAEFAKRQAEAKARVDAYTGALDDQTGAITDNTRAMVAQRAESEGLIEAAQLLGVASGDVTSAMLGDAEARERVIDTAKRYQMTLEESAGGVAASHREARYAQIDASEALIEGVNAESEALREAQAEVERVASEVEGSAEAHDVARQAVLDQVEAIQDLIDMYREASGAVLGEREATRQFEQAIDDATAAIEENGLTLDETTDKGRANQEALDGIAEAGWDLLESMRDNGASQEELQAALDRSRESLIATARAMGMSEEDARAYADEVLRIPPAATTTISTPGLDQSRERVDAFARAVLGLPSTKTVTITEVLQSTRSAVPASIAARADGGIDFMAHGGLRSVTPAHIARTQTTVYGEPGTGGEAYIPLAPSKRARSLDIWAETGRLLNAFGGQSGPIDLSDRTIAALGAVVVGGIGGGVANFSRAQSLAGRPV